MEAALNARNQELRQGRPEYQYAQFKPEIVKLTDRIERICAAAVRKGHYCHVVRTCLVHRGGGGGRGWVVVVVSDGGIGGGNEWWMIVSPVPDCGRPNSYASDCDVLRTLWHDGGGAQWCARGWDVLP